MKPILNEAEERTLGLACRDVRIAMAKVEGQIEELAPELDHGMDTVCSHRWDLLETRLRTLLEALERYRAAAPKFTPGEPAE